MAMKVLFAGPPQLATKTLAGLLDSEHSVVGVLTRQDAPQGRKRQLTPSPLASYAQDKGLPVIKANRWDSRVAQEISELGADIASVVAYGTLLPPAALDLLPHGWINLHFSDLPHWRGAAPVQRALMAGAEYIHSCTFKIEPSLDTGPVFMTEKTAVAAEDTAGEILNRLATSGARLLAETIEAIARGQAGKPQQGEPSYAPKLTLADGRINWNHKASEILARYRAVSPEPGPWCQLQEQKIKLGKLRLSQEKAAASPGTVEVKQQTCLVHCADYCLELELVQPAGKKMMKAADWARGLGPELKNKKVVLK